jgi:hypothetical protein
MDHQLNERREDARFAIPPRIELRATMRPGCMVVLVDVSARGALVQAARPMRPGARVHLQVITATRRVSIAGCVLRCLVWSLVGNDGVIYRAAVRFDAPVEWAWAETTRRVQGVPVHARPIEAGHGNTLPAGPSVTPVVPGGYGNV